MPLSHFYLSVPNADGVFMGNKASRDFEDFVSLYEFEILKDNPNKANFWLAPEAVSWALEDIDKRVKPVCESENYLTKKTKDVIIREKGIAELLEMSGNWKIERKAKIKYIETEADQAIISGDKDAEIEKLKEKIRLLEQKMVESKPKTEFPSGINLINLIKGPSAIILGQIKALEEKLRKS